jgi:hypothetical protein
MRTYPSAFIVLGLLSTETPALAAPQTSSGFTVPLLNGASPGTNENAFQPQFNDPGPQMRPRPPGNPVEQLSPVGNQQQPNSLGIR